MSLSDSQEQTISIPSLLLLAAVTALTIRYFFFSQPSASTSSDSNGRNTRGFRTTANPADVEQIASMFPQLGRRDIMWDLQRNGGSVAATTERILGGRGLDAPPPSFQPTIPPNTASTTASSTSSSTSQQPQYIDLIARYNLGGKVASSSELSEDSDTPASGTKKDQTWSNNRNERQAMLQQRREEMILSARRKLEETERRKEKGKGRA